MSKKQTNKRKKKFQFEIIFFKSDVGWVAQCLDYDFCANGKTVDEAQDNIEKVILGNFRLSFDFDKIPFDGVPKPSPEFSKMNNVIRRSFNFEARLC